MYSCQRALFIKFKTKIVQENSDLSDYIVNYKPVKKLRSIKEVYK